MSVTILVVEKQGTIKEVVLKSYDESELYKKAGLKSPQGFELQTEWGAEIDKKTYKISVFGKTTGRAGQENKYEFPPPIDNTLFFGSCVLVNKTVNSTATNLTKVEWNSVYEFLYGGFEDIGEEDSEISEDDVSEDVPRTKEGYVKDDFIVDDDEEDEDYETEEESEFSESSEEKPQKKAKTVAKKIVAVKAAKKDVVATKKGKDVEKEKGKTVFENILQEVKNNNYMECTDELEEEDYV